MTAVCPILVDSFESKAVVAELRRRELVFEITHLAAGDYGLPGGVLVERKEVRDLHLSVLEGRFWRQMGALRRVATKPYLLVEGADLDRGALHPHAVRGVCLAAGALGIQVLRSSSVVDTVTWLLVLTGHALRPPRHRPVYAQRSRSIDSSPAEAVLAGVPGISALLARRLLDRYGTVARLVGSDPATWEDVPGVGPAKRRRFEKHFSNQLREAKVVRPIARSVFERLPRGALASPAPIRRDRGTWEGILSAASFRT